MSDLYPLLLFLHVLGAILALGPAFAMPLIGGLAGREPAHGGFAARLSHLIEGRLVTPFILSTAVTGAAMIWVRGIPLFEPAYRWLLVSLLVYGAALAYSVVVQRPTLLRMVALTSAPPAAGPGGPPPELSATVARSRRNGLVLTALSLVLVFLMVVKPSLGL